MSPVEVKCTTCGSGYSELCHDKLRDEWFPLGIYHVSRIKTAKSETESELLQVQDEEIGNPASWRGR